MSTGQKRNRPVVTGRFYKEGEHEIVEAPCLLGAARGCLGTPWLPPGPRMLFAPAHVSTAARAIYARSGFGHWPLASGISATKGAAL